MQKILDFTPRQKNELSSFLNAIPEIPILEINNGLIKCLVGEVSQAEIEADLTHIFDQVSIAIPGLDLRKLLNKLPDQNNNFSLFEDESTYILNGKHSWLKIEKFPEIWRLPNSPVWNETSSEIGEIFVITCAEVEAWKKAVNKQDGVTLRSHEDGSYTVKGDSGCIFDPLPPSLRATTNRRIMFELYASILPKIDGAEYKITINRTNSDGYWLEGVIQIAGTNIVLRERLSKLFRPGAGLIANSIQK